jgi:hypothetical protein
MDIRSFDGLIDFLTLFNIAELLNILYSQSYEREGLSLRDRLSFVEARRLCRVILAWFADSYEISTSNRQEISVDKLQREYLRGQVRALLRYKYLEEDSRAGDQVTESYLGFEELSDMIKRCIEDGPNILAEYHQLLKDNPSDHYFENLSWPPSEKYELRPKVGRLERMFSANLETTSYLSFNRSTITCRDVCTHQRSDPC